MPNNPSPRSPRLVGALVALVGLALVGLALLGPTNRPGDSPSPGASASGRIGASSSPDATPPTTPTPRPTPASSVDLAAVEREIARIQEQVAAIRRLERLRPVENRLLPESELQAEIRAEFARANPQERLRAEEDLYERLGLLPANSDLAALVLEQLDQGLAGYYRPDREDMTIVKRSGGFGALERQVMAHEFTHALQDQHFNLDTFAINDATNSDRAMAQRALVEGDASLVQARWSDGNLSPAELTDVIRHSDIREQARITSGLPAVLLRQGAFPYLDGLLFVTTLDATDGWRAVNAAFRRPPQSTEQVLHPEKYRAAEPPVAVTVRRVVERLGAGWTQKIEDTLGEVNMQVWAAQASGPTASRRAAAGWGGDRVASFDGPNNAWAVFWRTEWDSATDASEFASVARAVVDGISAPGRVLYVTGSARVEVAFASSETIAGQLARTTAD
jgi:hypothetical protein